MRLLTTLLLFIFSASLFAQQYTPIPNQISGVKKTTVTLNGTWHFNPSPKKEFWKSTNSVDWKVIEVPGEWVMQGFNVEPNERAGYFRNFNIPNDWNSKEIILRCDAIYSDAILWINGKKVGSHLGGFTAFEFNVTQLIKSGENTISIGVINESYNDTLASGSKYAAHPLGGIPRKIYLFAVPKVHISDFEINTYFDKEYKNADLSVAIKIKKNRNVELTDAKLIFTLRSPSGESVLLDKNEIDASSFTGEKKEILFKIENPDKWHAEHPNLYKLEVELKNGSEYETIKQKFGFRQIDIVGNQVYLNGNPIKLRGVNRHEVHPLRGRSLTDEFWKKDAEIFKEGNCNYIRTSHYPPAEEFISYCDSIGLFVEIEGPFCWATPTQLKIKDKEKMLAILGHTYKTATDEMVEFYRNHPSIIIWSLANESAWTDQWVEIENHINQLDPTRPISFHDFVKWTWNGNPSTTAIANQHYPGPDGPNWARKFPRPILFGEFTHLQTYNRKEIATDPGVRDSWGRGFENMWDRMYYSAGCLGGAIWAGIDDVFHIPNAKAVGYGDWGPIDGWRREKPEHWHMKKSYSPVRIYNQIINIPSEGEPVLLQIENRFDITNLNECKIAWSIGDEKGVLQPDIAPHSYGNDKIYLKNSYSSGKLLSLKVYDPYSRLIDEYSIPIEKKISPDQPFEYVTFENLTLNKSEKQIIVSNDNLEWVFDAQSGEIIKAVVDGKKAISGGGVLMMLPLTTAGGQMKNGFEVEILNDPCTDWQADSIHAKEEEGNIIVFIRGAYTEAEGHTVYTFKPNGEVLVNYKFKSKIKINPRQIGLIFSVDKEYETLNWQRKTQWTVYPENHIGRARGSAKLSDKDRYPFKYGVQPDWEWRHDNNFLGSNDFRSSKDFIYWASLTNNAGNGLVVLSDADDSFRAFNDGDNISFLVAGFVTGGGDGFFRGHIKNEMRELNVGNEFKGSFKIKLIQ